MGYTTDFNGCVTINKPVDDATYELLKGIAETRRMKRGELPKEYGIDGEFYCEDKEDYGQVRNPSKGKIVDYNHPPSTQPSLWCQWLIQEDRQTIEWDGGEKFYDYVEWMRYIIDKILAPKGYIVNGKIEWQGEEWNDRGIIIVKDNNVTAEEKIDEEGYVECPECGHHFEV